MKRLLITLKYQALALIFLCLVTPIKAQTFIVDNNGVVTATLIAVGDLATLINSYDGDKSLIVELKVISTVNEVFVETSDQEAIATLTSLTKLDLSGVTAAISTIPKNFLSGNTTIKQCLFPVASTRVGIGENAFGSSALEGIVELPITLNDAGGASNGRFGNSQGITAFVIDEANVKAKTENGVVFTKDGGTIIYYPCGKTGDTYIIPEGVEIIGRQTFGSNHKLKEVTLPASATSIQDNRPYAIATGSTSIEAFYVANGNTVWSGQNGVVYSLESKALILVPPAMSKVKIPSPVETLATSWLFEKPGNITFIDFPESMKSLPNGSLNNMLNLDTIISRATDIPEIGTTVFNGVGWRDNRDNTMIYVPANAYDNYINSNWNRNLPGNTYKSFPAANFFAFYKLNLTEATAQSSIAADIAIENDIVTITADTAPIGKVFDKWTTTTSGVVFADEESETTTFTMPAGEVTIEATYKDSDELQNTGNDIDAIFTGLWDETAFLTFANSNAAQLTTIDLTGVTGLTMLPTIVNLNPNCLIYVDASTGITGKNIISFTGDSGSAATIELTDGYDFNNTKEFDATSISYKRNFSQMASNGWASICLPFAADMSDFDVKEFTAAETDENSQETTVTFTTANTFEANVPYIVNVEPTGQAADYEFIGNGTVYATNEFASEPQNGLIFKGNYRRIEAAAEGPATKLYLLQTDGSGFGKGVDTSAIPAFRAYIEEDIADAFGNIRSFAIDFDGGGSTNMDIENRSNQLVIFSNAGTVVINAPSAQTINIYAIDGRLIKTLYLNEGNNIFTGLSKGLYIVNNQKVAIN